MGKQYGYARKALVGLTSADMTRIVRALQAAGYNEDRALASRISAERDELVRRTDIEAILASVTGDEFAVESADELTRDFTAAESFFALVTAEKYRPTILVDGFETAHECSRAKRLADLYDYVQEERGDARRVFRGRKPRAAKGGT